MAAVAVALSQATVPSLCWRVYHLTRDQYRSMKLSSGWLGEEDAVVAPRDDEFLDGVLLLLEVVLLREEELEAACRAARPARVLRDIDALAFADARLSHGGLTLRLARGGACALELGRWIEKLALEEDLLDALRVPMRLRRWRRSRRWPGSAQPPARGAPP